MDKDDQEVGSTALDSELVQAVSFFSRSDKHRYDLAQLIAASQRSHDHGADLGAYDDLLRSRLANAVFVGHVNTDLDSVAGAIGAAALFGGTPAISEPADTLNGEIVFALKNSGIETPALFDTIENSAKCDVVLVDHTEEKQMVPSIRESASRGSRIVGVLDHHALAKTFYTSKPTFMDLRPWGSVSTIITVLFIRHKRALPKPLATLMLQAILSDTLNLRSVTTTEVDRGIVALLAEYSGISIQQGSADVRSPAQAEQGSYQETELDLLAKRQFQAKTEWIVALGAYEMVRGDQKDFSCGPWTFGISVLEVTDTSKVLSVAYEILLELRLLKKEKGLIERDLSAADKEPVDHGDGENSAALPLAYTLNRKRELDFAFLFVVNVVEQKSILLIPGGRELALAQAAFPGGEDGLAGSSDVRLTEAYPGIVAPGSTIRPEQTAMILPDGYVSRKAQFVPAFFRAIEDNFTYAAKGPVSLTESDQRTYTDADTSNVLAAIAQGKRSKSQHNPSAPEASDNTLLSDSVIAGKEREEEREFFEREQLYASSRDQNLYDEQGLVERTYGRPAP